MSELARMAVAEPPDPYEVLTESQPITGIAHEKSKEEELLDSGKRMEVQELYGKENEHVEDENQVNTQAFANPEGNVGLDGNDTDEQHAHDGHRTDDAQHAEEECHHDDDDEEHGEEYIDPQTQSSLFSLPPELREMIYDYLTCATTPYLDTDDYPYGYYEVDLRDELDQVEFRNAYNLMLSCKLVYYEAVTVCLGRCKQLALKVDYSPYSDDWNLFAKLMYVFPEHARLERFRIELCHDHGCGIQSLVISLDDDGVPSVDFLRDQDDLGGSVMLPAPDLSVFYDCGIDNLKEYLEHHFNLEKVPRLEGQLGRRAGLHLEEAYTIAQVVHYFFHSEPSPRLEGLPGVTLPPGW